MTSFHGRSRRINCLTAIKCDVKRLANQLSVSGRRRRLWAVLAAKLSSLTVKQAEQNKNTCANLKASKHFKRYF